MEVELFSGSRSLASVLLYLCERYASKEKTDDSNEGVALHYDGRKKFLTKRGIRFQGQAL